MVNQLNSKKLDMTLDDVIAMSPTIYRRQFKKKEVQNRARLKKNQNEQLYNNITFYDHRLDNKFKLFKKRRGRHNYFPNESMYHRIVTKFQLPQSFTEKRNQLQQTRLFTDTLGCQDENGLISDGEILDSANKSHFIRKRIPFFVNLALSEGRYVQIKGLDYSILTTDLEELFRTIGPLEKCWIDYDKTDRSMGTGAVIFKSVNDARMAVNRFDGRFIDGQALQLSIVGNYNNI